MHATGDRHLVVTDIAAEPWHRWACTVPCDWLEFVRAHFGPEPDVLLFACSRAIFGPSGQWGALTHQAYTEHADMPNYALLGGDRTFMSVFADACGGYAELRRRFVNHLSFDPLPSWPSLPDDVKEGVLADIGWDSQTNPTQ